MAIYTIYAAFMHPRGVQDSAFTPRKLLHTIPSRYSYGALPPNFHMEGCNTSPATLPHGNIAK